MSMRGWKLFLAAALLPGALALAQTPSSKKPAAPAGDKPAAADQAQAEKPPNPPRPLDESRVSRGKAVYQRYCFSCHGENGDGRGYSAQWLDPRPRDFTRAVFKCRSTPSGTLPVDDDLLRTLREGLYHTNMPSWAALGERTMRDVAEYIKTFSPRWKEEGPGDPVAYAPEPPDGAESREKGKAVWNAQACFNCHGQGGKGDGASVPTLFDDWGFHITPFDFTSSPHRKCGNGDKDLYRTFLTGLNGSPMPSFADTVTPEDAWHLVHFLKTLRVENTEQHLLGFSVGK
jgi:cytochrome c oxidase cbb3-type subunit I/II